MNRFIPLLCAAACSFALASCSLNDDSDRPNVIGGSASPMTQIGNTITTGSIKVGSNYYAVSSSMSITGSTNGVATVKLTADLTQEPGVAMFNGWIPSTMKDANGRVDTEFKIKATSEGMQTYFKGDSPHTLVKFDAAVGDKYVMKRDDGETYTRTVTEKTNQDDFPYGLMNIKTIKVEQTTSNALMGIAGIEKVVYRVNHRFGIVYLELVAEDGSTASTYLYSAIENQ